MGAVSRCPRPGTVPAGRGTITATTFLACPTVVRQVAKGQGCLNSYQIRGWIAERKHVPLAIFAQPFLAVAADDARVTRPSHDAPSIEAIRRLLRARRSIGRTWCDRSG
ncbi:hypothetical protein GCM10022284_70400 [Streptomyces hundungensis]